MSAIQLLKTLEIKSDDTIFSMTKAEAMEKLLGFIKEWKLSIEVKNINKQDWEILFDSYAYAIATYHSENFHQERYVFLKNEKMLKKYGLIIEEVARLDFC